MRYSQRSPVASIDNRSESSEEQLSTRLDPHGTNMFNSVAKLKEVNEPDTLVEAVIDLSLQLK